MQNVICFYGIEKLWLIIEEKLSEGLVSEEVQKIKPAMAFMYWYGVLPAIVCGVLLIIIIVLWMF